ALFRGPTGRLALDDVELAQGGVTLLAVGQLAWQGAAVQRALAANEVAGLSRSFARPGRVDRLADDLAGNARVLLEERAKLVVDDGFDDTFDFRVAELGLGLSLELRMRDLDAHDR